MKVDHRTKSCNRRGGDSRFRGSLAALALAAAAQPVSALAGTTLDPGPDPTWEGAVRLVEAALRETLIDPQSAQIQWPYNFVSGSLKAPLGKRRAGWYTCGRLNAKNRMGGYSGQELSLAMVNSGRVVDLDVGTIDAIDAASATCPKLAANGTLPPAPAAGSGTAPVPISNTAFLEAAEKTAAEAATRGGLGITFQPTARGALLIAVAPGSPAGLAGLKPGFVIERVNDIDVAGADQAILSRLFAGAGQTVTVDIAGASKVTITRNAATRPSAPAPSGSEGKNP